MRRVSILPVMPWAAVAVSAHAVSGSITPQIITAVSMCTSEMALRGFLCPI